MNLDILNQRYLLTEEQIDFYGKNRFIKLKNVLDENTLAHFNRVISNKVEELKNDSTPMAERDTYGKAFLQLFNLWRTDPEIRKLIFSKRIGQIAADLMQVEGVRIYHDQALFKEAGGGITPWHADQFYWPLSSDKTITAWIPLQVTPLSLGPLEFSAGSHVLHQGRDMKISDESESFLKEKLRINSFPHVIEPFEAGEISFHSGWVFHRAGANQSNQMRKVMTTIYMDKQMVLKKPDNKNQQKDWETWCPGALVDEVIDTPMNPVII